MDRNHMVPCYELFKNKFGMKNYYTEKMAKRLHAMKQPNYRNDLKVTTHPHAIDMPRRLKKPRTIFVNSIE